MSGFHIFGWTSRNTIDVSRCTRRISSSTVKGRFKKITRSCVMKFVLPSILASNCIGHSRARNAETASDGMSVMCAAVILPATSTFETQRSCVLSMELMAQVRRSMAAVLSALGKLTTHSPVRARFSAVLESRGKSNVTRNPLMRADTTWESTGDLSSLRVLTRGTEVRLTTILA